MLAFPRAVLPPGRSQLVLEDAGDPPATGPRSHLGDGRRVVLVGAPVGWVVDAEVRREPPPALARRFGAADFWARWTRAECAAKLTSTPVGLWLARYGLDEPDPRRFVLVTSATGAGALTVSLGRACRPGVGELAQLPR